MTDGVFVFPTSFAQQRLWFLDQLEPGSSFYNVRATFEFEGPIDRLALAWALDEIVRRHEALRTTFTSVDGQPVQVVARELVVPLPEVDLRRLPEAERLAETARISCTELERPFDLERGPLIRARLVFLSDAEQQLIVTLHHIICDGWSLDVLEGELRALYAARAAGTPHELSPLAIQYADFAVWQRTWLTGDVLESQLSYWTTQLRGLPAVLTLPTDRPSPAIQSFRGASQQIRLGGALAESLRALSRREGVTLFMCLLAAFDVLLSRYTGQDDIVVGTPVAGRNRAETAPLIGFFVNTLALRTDLSGDPSFLTLLERVREVALGAYAHQDLPFEKLVEAVQPERSLGHHPLFQVMFQLITAQAPVRHAAGASAAIEDLTGADEDEVESGTAKFDLSMDVVEVPEGLVAAIEYRTDLFDHATIRRMLLNFRELLEDLAAHPERPISRSSMVAVSEREQMLRQWNDTGRAYPHDTCIPELFERQVAAAPGRVAVKSEAGTLTYGELNARANKLARYLRAAGVGADCLVGLCIDRSLDMVVGLLGILKAGGAYLPLDPEYPKGRLGFMLEDAGARMLVTQAHLVDALPAHGARVVCIDRDWETIDREEASNLPASAGPQNLAYVIYTSGSTGKPKGVMIEHRSLVALTAVAIADYGLRAEDRILQFSALSFDTAGEEIFPCLTIGAMLCLRSRSMASSIQEFLTACREWQVGVLDLPTAFWHELAWEIASRNLSVPPSLRLMIVGGERMQPERVAMWYRAAPARVRLMQGYGPTETTVTATIADLSPLRSVKPPLSEVPIGRVIGNSHAYVLDRQQAPVPIGVTGELYIGGAGLARGYLHRPGLTAERFVPNPFSREPGARLYRTGDLVRYLPDGQIEFLGRCDEQVKIRGYRIELGEIESLLLEHADVRDAVVTVREEPADNKRLIAYVVADQSNGFSLPALRQSLRDRLPEYMLPASFVLLDALPLTPSGKVDRRALPEPAPAGDAASGSRLVPPRNETERIIAAIWQEFFPAGELSVHANFFDLGGHSLTLVRVRGRLRDHFAEDISIVDLFRYPTIRALSDHLTRNLPQTRAIEPPLHAARQIDARAQKQKGAFGRRKPISQERALGDE